MPVKTSVYLTFPLERNPTPDEERIVAFITYAIDAAFERQQRAIEAGKMGTAYEAQLTGLALQTLSDAILAGLHDKDHPARFIDPKDQARLHFGAMA